MFKKRKAISMFLLVVMLFSTTATFANAPITTEQITVNDEIFDISYSQDGNIRTATIYEDDGTVNILQIDDITGKMTYNGELIHEEIIYSEEPNENNPLITTTSNWGSPTTEVVSLSVAAFGMTALIGYLNLKFGIPSTKAAYIANLVIAGGGFLYLKSVLQLNYVDYAPKIGYRLTESLHLTRAANGTSLYNRTTTGSR